ncbi:MAG: hypothetical protein NZP74_04975 [Anaerolineales bacterium]|nr:hypothetical protein [Anaerolineales bacterium]MDW8278820.1 hypothetical protein [Anaerolineales bacterium]
MNGRKLLIALSAGVLVMFYTAALLFGENAVWQALNIPTHHPSFIDLRGLLSGFDAARLGFDPLYENPRDPYHRPVVYPRLWLALGWFGLSETHTEIAAYLLIGSFGISVLSIKGYDKTTALLLSLVLFSPAALMCYKFANVEMVIFILLAAALALEPRSFWGALTLIELAAFLKIFPILALGYLLKYERKEFLRKLALGTGIFLLYIVLTWQDTLWILGHAPKGALESYGAGVIAFRVYELTNSRDWTAVTNLPLYLLLYGLMIAALFLSSRHANRLPETTSRFLDAFRIGSLIYIGSFIQGNSFNYRLIFLLCVIPQLVDWAKTQPSLRSAARWTLGLLLASCWGMVLVPILPVHLAFGLDELANWLLFAALLYLLFVSSPDWIRDEIDAAVRRYRNTRYKI